MAVVVVEDKDEQAVADCYFCDELTNRICKLVGLSLYFNVLVCTACETLMEQHRHPRTRNRVEKVVQYISAKNQPDVKKMSHVNILRIIDSIQGETLWYIYFTPKNFTQNKLPKMMHKAITGYVQQTLKQFEESEEKNWNTVEKKIYNFLSVKMDCRIFRFGDELEFDLAKV